MIEQLMRETNARAATPDDSIDGVTALAVCAPRDDEEARHAIAFCSQKDIAIIARGGGTKLHIGALPLRPFVVLSSENLTEIYDHDEGNATVSAGAGISLRALNQAVGARGQFVPIEGPENATLGGLVATNHWGAWKTKYGAPRDLVVGLSALLSDGRVVENRAKVVKNVAGYDLAKIFTGSFGSLGFLTRITIRLRPRDAATSEWSASFDSWGEAEKHAAKIFDGAFEPTLLQLCGDAQGVVLRARFDGGENAVAIQLSRLPQSQNVELQEKAATWEIAATLPIRSASDWTQEAREQGAHTNWDFALGRVKAHFQTAPDIAILRQMAENAGGFCIVERAPEKTADIVWGTPRGDFAHTTSLKAKFDAVHLFAPGRFIGGL
ncbi:MAG TPA: FAD-binding oxidoreductase [Abditibacteriaceae bacterium]|jgi:glycolate oxidase FAD binding subunit